MIKERVERKLEKSGRITPREVLEAYEETGYEVSTNCWIAHSGNESVAACALTARAAQHYGIRAGDEVAAFSLVDAFMDVRFSHEAWSYRDGFAQGFDGTISRREWQSDAEATGYRDGQRARRFVLSNRVESRSDVSN